MKKRGMQFFSKIDRWLLIEFKRSKVEVATEKFKFSQYDAAFRNLAGNDKHHLIIYGEPGVVEPIKLIGRTYFSEKIINLDNLYHTGIDHDAFWVYVIKFHSFKNAQKGGGETQYASVLGVSPNGTVTKLLTLYEYAQLISLHKVKSHTLVKERTEERSQGLSR